jgi:CRISPR/Cas system-associated exonuclease Cas4 (RecB family)
MSFHISTKESFDLYLSYSGKRSYQICPKQYRYTYVLKQKSETNPKDVLFGNTIGKIFERFYNDKLWLRPDVDSYMMSLIEDTIDECASRYSFNPRSDPDFKSKLIRDLQEFIPATIKIIRNRKLLAPLSIAEADLTVVYRDKESGIVLKIGGRSDFIHYFNKNNIWILDGKGSKYKDKYVDSDQLIWYAIQHYLKYYVAPSRLGFIFYKFPSDPIKWIMIDDQSIRDNLKRTFQVASKILNNMFDPTPSPECRRCPFLSMCDDGAKYLANRRNKDGPIQSSIFELEMVT